MIGFPDYSPLKHDVIEKQTKMGFDDRDFTNTISVINYMNPLNAFNQ